MMIVDDNSRSCSTLIDLHAFSSTLSYVVHVLEHLNKTSWDCSNIKPGLLLTMLWSPMCVNLYHVKVVKLKLYINTSIWHTGIQWKPGIIACNINYNHAVRLPSLPPFLYPMSPFQLLLVVRLDHLVGHRELLSVLEVPARDGYV